ncbi:MAG: hypothetical protein HY688_01345 [Chloroflexi bacterium]|nr:hypothetical protein [Chloroflexota bacterium]
MSCGLAFAIPQMLGKGTHVWDALWLVLAVGLSVSIWGLMMLERPGTSRLLFGIPGGVRAVGTILLYWLGPLVVVGLGVSAVVLLAAALWSER